MVFSLFSLYTNSRFAGILLLLFPFTPAGWTHDGHAGLGSGPSSNQSFKSCYYTTSTFPYIITAKFPPLIWIRILGILNLFKKKTISIHKYRRDLVIKRDDTNKGTITSYVWPHRPSRLSRTLCSSDTFNMENMERALSRERKRLDQDKSSPPSHPAALWSSIHA